MSYRPKAFALDDVPTLHWFIRAHAFATIATVWNGEAAIAYAPVILNAEPLPLGSVRFHLARANPLAAMDRHKVRMIFHGPDAYVSPDWYGTEGRVPTWNYIAVEATGYAERLGEAALRDLLVDLSAEQEAHLLPKPPWTLEKLSEEQIAGFLRAIVGFRVTLETLEGKFKLSQDKSAGESAGVAAALDARGDPASHTVAAAMRRYANNIR